MEDEIPAGGSPLYVLAVVDELCQAIVDGRLDPVAGSAQIWQRCVYHRQIPEVLRFIGLASEWEDWPDLRSEFEADIAAYAADVLARRTASYQTAG